MAEPKERFGESLAPGASAHLKTIGFVGRKLDAIEEFNIQIRMGMQSYWGSEQVR